MAKAATAPAGGFFANWRQNIIYIGFVVIFIVFALTLNDKGFLNPNNLLNIVRQTAMIAVMAVAMTFVLSAGEIDLSVGAVAGLALAAGVPLALVEYLVDGPADLLAEQLVLDLGEPGLGVDLLDQVAELGVLADRRLERERLAPAHLGQVVDLLDRDELGDLERVLRQATTLAAVEQKYTVEQSVLLAIWSMESNYGTVLEQPERLFYVPSALATLAYGDLSHLQILDLEP